MDTDTQTDPRVEKYGGEGKEKGGRGKGTFRWDCSDVWLDVHVRGVGVGVDICVRKRGAGARAGAGDGMHDVMLRCYDSLRLGDRCV